MFNKSLQKLRKEKNLTQEELAEKMEMSTSAIGMYERGSRQPDFSLLEKFADFFDVSTDYLLGRTNIRDKLIGEALKDNPELIEFWEEMQKRDDLFLLFKKTKELNPDAVKKIIEVIKLIEDNEDKEFDRK